MEQEINRILTSLVKISNFVSIGVKKEFANVISDCLTFASAETKKLYEAALNSVSIEPHRLLVREIEQELERFVLLAFSKVFDRNDQLINLAVYDRLEWVDDGRSFVSVGLKVAVRAEYTDSGWRTQIEFENLPDHGDVPECIRSFSFDVDSCADDHFRSNNTFETFQDDMCGVNLPRYVVLHITEEEANSALEWLQSYFVYLRCME